EGDEKKVEEYLDPDSEKYGKMVKEIARDLGMDSLMFQRLDDLVKAIGLPREKLCTHCWDGSGKF
ncbi:MAG TPA: amidophosphoribosyltransferase, partial [Bacteroidales bacterium]|nr:amidophosphoribosyltransferase [Bacteroidales bacterium]